MNNSRGSSVVTLKRSSIMGRMKEVKLVVPTKRWHLTWLSPIADYHIWGFKGVRVGKPLGRQAAELKNKKFSRSRSKYSILKGTCVIHEYERINK